VPKVLLFVTGEVEIYEHVNFFLVIEEFTLTSLWLVRFIFILL
jgi:hypothetical protein